MVLQLERVVCACLLLFLLIIVAFLWYFPVRLNRNTKAYCFGFSTFFLAKAVAPFLFNTGGMSAANTANWVNLGGVFLCQVMWLLAISNKGAEATPAFHRSWTEDEQKQILATLNSFEQQISRSRGR